MSDESAEKKRLIEKEYPTFSFPIERGKVREFADAVLDDNAIFRDEKAAIREGFRSIPAPLTFTLASIFFWPRELHSILSDAGLDERYILHAEHEFEYERMPIVGELLEARTRVTDYFAKQGKRGGKLTFLVVETSWFDNGGKLVLKAKETSVQTEHAVTAG